MLIQPTPDVYALDKLTGVLLAVDEFPQHIHPPPAYSIHNRPKRGKYSQISIIRDNDEKLVIANYYLSAPFIAILEYPEGLVFKKGDVHGNCFIEYIPAERAWCPIEAEGYMFIHCLWVSGQFKRQDNSTLLLDDYIQDSRDKKKAELCILSSIARQNMGICCTFGGQYYCVVDRNSVDSQ